MNELFYDYFSSGHILISSKLSTLIKRRGYFFADILRYRGVRYLHSLPEFGGIVRSPLVFAIFISLELFMLIYELTISCLIIGALLSFVVSVLLVRLVNQISLSQIYRFRSTALHQIYLR